MDLKKFYQVFENLKKNYQNYRSFDEREEESRKNLEEMSKWTRLFFEIEEIQKKLRKNLEKMLKKC